jgi:hypothetical protein
MEISADYTDYADFGLDDASAGSKNGTASVKTQFFYLLGNAQSFAEICVI